ncbi:uncharacterized protein LOC114581389 [Dendrobium catenatum]|uniref:uncharacterized protein LOC114581389 n=1 Tax=Dendrobium catenatum TaxID=906689 RepID=UPI0010A04ED7|nr:uncharacterized protein LOC114581389 [Dendrobium catenatum]
MDSNWKDTLIVLIPKNSNPLLPSNYKHISLCNSVYKVAAKVILNRLLQVIPLLISDEQAAFIKGRSVSDHVLMAQEMFHKFRYSKAPKGMVSYKIAMEQAYDSMSWTTLKQVLYYFEFPSMISKLILECVINLRFSIIINGKLSGWIKAENGFRQGCPLPPILFILCSQRLSNAFSYSSIGISLCPNSPQISHLLYADDVMIFTEASRKADYEVRSILSNFSKWTGQSINVEKMLNIWGTKTLSLAEKIALIKSIILAIPNYYSTHSLVPVQLVKEVDKICRGFLWDKAGGNAGLHYISWEELYKPLKGGGCGLFSSITRVAPLRARLSWRYLHNKDSFFHRVLAPKYGTIFGASGIKKNSSSSWKILCNAGKALDPFIKWNIANSNSINVFKDKWILDRRINEWPTFVAPQGDEEFMLSRFIEGKNWKEENLKQVFGGDLVDLILKININPNQVDDDRELIYQGSRMTIPGMIIDFQ